MNKGKQRYGADEQPGYEEILRTKPNPKYSNDYNFSEQGQASMDHWGGKSEAMAGGDEPTPVKRKEGDTKELAKDIEDSHDVSLHDEIKAHNETMPHMILNPGKVDEAKWSEAKKAAEKEYGPGKWAVVSHIYKKMGGEFHHK